MRSRFCVPIVTTCLLASGCAYTIIKPVDYGDTGRRGYRIYDPQPILVSTCETTSIAFVPNLSRGYSVQPRAWLSKNKSELKVASGMLSEAAVELDSTAFLTLLQSVGGEAIKAAEKLAALGDGATGGLRQAGVWSFDYDARGLLTGLRPLVVFGDCAAPTGSGRARAEGEEPPAGGGKPRP